MTVCHGGFRETHLRSLNDFKLRLLVGRQTDQVVVAIQLLGCSRGYVCGCYVCALRCFGLLLLGCCCGDLGGC